MIFKTSSGSIDFHESPWDERVLKCKTANISTLVVDSTSAYSELLKAFVKQYSKLYKFVSFRVYEYNLDLFDALVKNDFEMVEKSYLVKRSSSVKSDNVFINPKCVITTDLNVDDQNTIIEIAQNDFRYGRFFEDTNISNQIAKERNVLWINDIINNKNIDLVGFKYKNKTVGFMAYKEEGYTVSLLIGGITPSYAHLAYGFWSLFFQQYCENKNIETVISCSNLGVVNLYSFFNFKFDKILTGFHFSVDR